MPEGLAVLEVPTVLRWGIRLLTMLCLAEPAAAQAVNPVLLTSRWQAQWIRHAGAPRREFGVYHFRRTFDLPSVPARFVVHATADQRYELFVNGTRVATGPARGDLNHWRFETVDLAPHLAAGTNVLAAVVWNFAEHAPMAQVSHETGWLLQGDTADEAVVNTGPAWKSLANPAITAIPIDRPAIFFQYFVSGPGEQVDAARYPWGWEGPAFDDSGWPAAQPIVIGGPRGIRDTPSRWMLVPRTIPLMEERPEPFARVRRSQGAAPPASFASGGASWTIPPRTKTVVLLDRDRLTTAYPEVVTTGGRGASVALTYAEALFTPRADGRRGEKGHRDQIDGKSLTGLQDRYLPDGGARRRFRPLWWRTYRYVELAVETADEPLTIDSLGARFSAYPFDMRATFESSDPALRRIFDVGWWTVRLCAHETYMDTPYWEQLQYVGDTRIQALVSLYLAGDDRLVKNAIAQFDDSRTTDGLTQSRYPTDLPQIIPPFSLFWIGMLHDLWWYSGDTPFLKAYLPGARGVIEWFEAHLTPDGLLGRLEWWNYADWVDAYRSGEPPTTANGESAILTLQFAAALREAADLEEAFGSRDLAVRYRALASRVTVAVVRACWDEARGLVADTPERRTFSQHANLFAVLAGAFEPARARAVMERVLADASVTQATYYFRFYLFRAMARTGLASRYLDQLGPWRQMLDLGLTTWAERPEPTRSDSHAWSAHPSVDLLALVAGISPARPGFSEVRIEPHLGTLDRLSATVPTPKGDVRVEYRRAGTALRATVTLPPGVTGTLVWNGNATPLGPGRQEVAVQ